MSQETLRDGARAAVPRIQAVFGQTLINPQRIFIEEFPMYHPFADLIELKLEEQTSGNSRCTLSISEKHLNPHKVVHGAVVYALADTGMGAAIYPTLASDEICATIEIKINYYRPVFSGVLTCMTKVVNRGKTIANIESCIFLEGDLIAKANGNYSIFRSKDFGIHK